MANFGSIWNITKHQTHWIRIGNRSTTNTRFWTLRILVGFYHQPRPTLWLRRISCSRFSSHDERCHNPTDDPWRHRGDMDRLTADTYSLSGNQNMYPNKLCLVTTTQVSYWLENTLSWKHGMETGHQLSIVTDKENRLTRNASLSRFHHKPQFEITSITVWMDRTAQRSQVAAPTWSGKQLTVYAQPS